jgi:phosphoserine phosphatase
MMVAGSRHERAGQAMTGGEKPGSDGTDPKAMGSNQQNAAQPPGARRRQQRDMTDQMDQLRKQDTATIDSWLVRQLNQLYSEVISEPLPKDMQELIDELGKKTSTK